MAKLLVLTFTTNKKYGFKVRRQLACRYDSKFKDLGWFEAETTELAIRSVTRVHNETIKGINREKKLAFFFLHKATVPKFPLVNHIFDQQEPKYGSMIRHSIDGVRTQIQESTQGNCLRNRYINDRQ